MNRSSRLLILALAAVLAGDAAADDVKGRFAEGLLGVGAGAGNHVAVTQPIRQDPPIVFAEGRSYAGHADGNRIERVLGEFLVEMHDEPTGDTGPPGPGPSPEMNLPVGRPAVAIESMLSGNDFGNHDRVHELLIQRPARVPTAESSPERVVAADFFTGAAEEAATVQIADEQLPPPPPPTVPGTAESPQIPPAAADAAPASVSARTGATVQLSDGFIDPRYQSSGESSIYTSTCQRCGRTYCHCVYAPFGDAVRSAFGRQVHLGSAALMTLYAHDFHPQGTSYQSRLTPRGEHQLDKIVNRLQYTPSPVRIEATGQAELDAARRIRVSEALAALGIPDASTMVVTVRAGNGRPAIELLESSYDILESIRSRGRTIQGSGTATFSGGAQFGQ